MTGRREFLKSSTTTVTVEKSISSLEKLVRRYGANRFSTSVDYDSGRALVRFQAPEEPGGEATVPIQLRVDPKPIQFALYGERPTVAQKAQLRGTGWSTAHRHVAPKR